MTTDTPAVDDSYRSVAEYVSVRYDVRGSKFIGHLAPASTVEEAEEFIEDVAADHAEATHNVPAYRLRTEPFREWSSDDGEPSGSAGKPVLNVLQGRGLENVVAVVTRYFGGTKLGYGGLVAAYSRTAARTVDSATLVEQRPTDRLTAIVEYDDSGTVRSVLESADVEFSASYESDVRFAMALPRTEKATILDRLRTATNGRVRVESE